MRSTKIMLTGVVLLLLANLFVELGGGDLSVVLLFAGLLVFAVGLLYKDNDTAPLSLDKLPQKKCANCGIEYDFDYARCPHCGQENP